MTELNDHIILLRCLMNELNDPGNRDIVKELYKLIKYKKMEIERELSKCNTKEFKI